MQGLSTTQVAPYTLGGSNKQASGSICKACRCLIPDNAKTHPGTSWFLDTLGYSSTPELAVPSKDVASGFRRLLTP